MQWTYVNSSWNRFLKKVNLLQPPINHTFAWARLVTFVYVKFAQILKLKVVSNNSINGLQCYIFRIFITLCYGGDVSNGSWGLFWVFFGHAHLKPPNVESNEEAELWHQNKATQSVIKLFSAILCDSVGQWILFGVGQWLFIWCQSLTSCNGGYVISTWFSIVWEPKNSICGYAECARANRTMVVDVCSREYLGIPWRTTDGPSFCLGGAVGASREKSRTRRLISLSLLYPFYIEQSEKKF